MEDTEGWNWPPQMEGSGAVKFIDELETDEEKDDE